MSETWYVASWLFLLGSFTGVALEAAWQSAVDRHHPRDPRAGILFLPLNPLYGAATLVGATVLHPLAATPALVFLVGAAMFSAIEYVASLVLERFFGSVFWDYSDRPFNLHGRICVEFAGYWGLLALVLVYVADPALRVVIDRVPRPAGDLLASTLLVATLGAAIATTLGFARLRQRIADRLAERSGAPRSRWQRLADRVAPTSAVLAAFPRLNLSARYRRLMVSPPRSPRVRSGGRARRIDR